MTDHESRLRAALEAGPTAIVALSAEQVQALYLFLFRREGEQFDWMEPALKQAEAVLQPWHDHFHDRQFNAMNRQFFGDDRHDLPIAPAPDSFMADLRSLLDELDALRAKARAFDQFIGQSGGAVSFLADEVERLGARQTESLDPAGVERLARGIGMVIGEDGPDERFELSFTLHELMLFVEALRATTSRGDSAKRLSDAGLGVERCGANTSEAKDAERYRWLRDWLRRQGLLHALFCQPEAGMSAGDFWVLRKVYMVNGNGCDGYGKTDDDAIDNAISAANEAGEAQRAPDARVTQGHSHGSEQDGPNSGSGSEKNA